jgi:hypothetical protein
VIRFSQLSGIGKERTAPNNAETTSWAACGCCIGSVKLLAKFGSIWPIWNKFWLKLKDFPQKAW